jgi:hypothetical protein
MFHGRNVIVFASNARGSRHHILFALESRMRNDYLYDMEQKFKDAGATYVWKKPLPSNSTIIEQLRKSLPGLNGTSSSTTTTIILLPGRPPAPPYQPP